VAEELPSSVIEVSVDTHDQNLLVSVQALPGLGFGLVLVLIGGFPVDMPMPTHALGWVTPTCSLTRGSTALLRGEWGLAWRYNPASYAVIGFGLFGLARWLIGMLSGRWVNFRFRARSLVPVTAVVIGLLWWIQQSHAEFVISARR
jgi:hypothetical protein